MTLMAMALTGCSGDRMSFGGAAPAVPADVERKHGRTLDIGGAELAVLRHGIQRRAGRAHWAPSTPDGGCPGNFYTSRQWAMEQNALVIRDNKNQPLAQLICRRPLRRAINQRHAHYPVPLAKTQSRDRTMAEYQLYCFAQSGNAYRAALMLNLIGADWEPVWIDFFDRARSASHNTATTSTKWAKCRYWCTDGKSSPNRA